MAQDRESEPLTLGNGATTTAVVTRRTPAGAPAIRERWPMTCQPPPRPAEPTLSSTGKQ